MRKRLIAMWENKLLQDGALMSPELRGLIGNTIDELKKAEELAARERERQADMGMSGDDFVRKCFPVNLD